MPGADIDLLLIVPYFVEREHFFKDGGLCGLLAECDEVNGLHAVVNAFVPVIKFTVRGIAIDLLLSRLKLPVVSAEVVSADMGERLLHRCIEETDAHSLNGARVAPATLELVPNVANFRSALRTVKLWVARRGLGCFIMGYPGGVAWAILTARVCQLYPNSAPSVLVTKFFWTWGLAWKWGTKGTPVFLNNIEQSGSSDFPAHLAANEWTGKNPRERDYVMSVITPCRPRLNATHSVCRSTLAVLKSELERAARVLQQPPHPGSGWGGLVRELLQEIDFFRMYRGYVAVHVFAESAEQQLYWCAWVKSRMRRLVLLLEVLPTLDFVHPLPHTLQTRPSNRADNLATTPHSCCFFIGLSFLPSAAAAPVLDLRAAADKFIELVCAWALYPKLCPSGQLQLQFDAPAQLPPELLQLPLPIIDDGDEPAFPAPPVSDEIDL